MSGCRRLVTIAALAWLSFGAFFVAHAVVSAWRSYRLVSSGRTATAKVMDSENIKRTNYPILVFAAANGTPIRFESTAGPRRGETVPIRCDPDAPNVVKVDSFRGLWMSPIVEAVVGTLLFLAPGGLLLRFRPPASPAPPGPADVIAPH